MVNLIKKCVEVNIDEFIIDSVQENQVLDSLLESLSRQEATQSLLSNELESQAKLIENLDSQTENQDVLIRSTHQNLLQVQSEVNTSFDLFWIIIGLLFILFGLLIFIKYT